MKNNIEDFENLIINENDENQVMGLRDFFSSQLDQIIYPYIYDNNLMFSNPESKVYREDLELSAEVDSLVKISRDTTRTPEEKKKAFMDTKRDIYERLKAIMVEVGNAKNNSTPSVGYGSKK